MLFYKRETCPYCLHKYNHSIHDKCPNCDSIDYKNIEEVFIMRIEERYHEEVVDVFDIVKTYDYTQQDGWDHYETNEDIQNIYDGTFYTFLILYKNGTEEIREYEESNRFCTKLKPLVNSLAKEVINETENFTNVISDMFLDNEYQQIINELWDDLMKFQNGNDDDISRFVEKKMKYLKKCTYIEYVQYLRKILVSVLFDETEGDMFEDSLESEIQFLQPVKGKYDAFVLLQRKDKVHVEEIERYLALKRKNDYRKIVVIFNTSLEKKAYSYIDNKEMVLWDSYCIKQLLLKCYEKILLQKIDEKIEELNNED